MRGSQFNDVLLGTDANVHGREDFRGRRGDDTIDGKGGTDRVDYRGETVRVVVDLSGQDSSGFGFSQEFDTTNGDALVGADIISNIEQIRGSFLNDTLIGDSQANVILGESGDDTITGNAGDDTMTGGDGNDTFVATFLAGNDVITDFTAGAGTDDRLDATALGPVTLSTVLANTVDVNGNAVITAGGGTVTLTGVTKSQLHIDDFIGVIDDLAGSTTGDDVINGTANDDVISGQAGNDTINGLAGNDTLNGDEGDDVIDGGAGNDTINGGDGIDTINYGDDAGDGGTAGVTVNLLTGTAIDGFGNTDTVSFVENVAGTAFADSLTGDAGTNQLPGEAGNDSLDGGAGGDILKGGGGQDRIIGGIGVDNMTGGFNSDTFVFNGRTDGTSKASNGPINSQELAIDDVLDFLSGTDGIELAASDFDLGGATITTGINFEVIGSAFDGTNATSTRFQAGQGTLILDADGRLISDTNGSAAGYTVVADFGGANAVAATDITVV